MTNYSIRPGMVRCEQFKPSGKWYQTFAIDMNPYYDTLDIHEAVTKAIEDKVGRQNLGGWIYVVLDPYHQNSYPVMIKGE